MKPPFAHQVDGAKRLAAARYLLLGDEMRCGKTRTAIDAVQALFEADEVDQAVVVAPAPVRGVWCDPEFGQLAEYSRVPVEVTEYRAKCRTWRRGREANPEGVRRGGSDPTCAECRASSCDACDHVLRWVVTNYEFVRRPERLAPLLKRCNARTVLVLDEAMAVKSWASAQTKACLALRERCGRVYLLNGTPEGDTPLDQFAQFNLLDPGILDCRGRNQYTGKPGRPSLGIFRSRYAVMDPYGFKVQGRPVQVAKWVNLDDLSRRTAPYVLRRTMAQCFDLPQRIPPVTLAVPLGPEVWRLYKELRAESVAWLTENATCTAAQAGVRVLRLAQLTAGFLGGIETVGEDDEATVGAMVREVGREKLDLFLEWLRQRWAEEPEAKVLVWCRFRPELDRLAAEVERLWPGRPVGRVWGTQRKAEREAAVHLLYPPTAPTGPALVVGTPRTGGFGLDLSAAHEVVYASNDYSRVVREQSEARTLGPRQTRPCSYFDVVATGPDGQRTVDHAVLAALRRKAQDAGNVGAMWAAALREE